MTGMNAPLALSNAQARKAVLALQGLCDPPHRAFETGGLLSLIKRLGFVQVDSIQWVERAQHMTLFARNQTYRPNMLKRMIERDQALFEGWTHDASIIPAEFYPYWKHRFARQEAALHERFRRWQGEGFHGHCDELMVRIAENGGLRSRDLERKDAGPQQMWQWHDGKAALEYLWRTGRLCIAARDGFQKVYDLPERALQPHHLQAAVSHEAFVDWACRAALQRLGFGSPGDIARYFDLVTNAEARDWVERAGPNTLIPVTVGAVKGHKDRELVARPDIHSVIESAPDAPERLRALTPFDPVIRDRNRLDWLFSFDYRIEIYVPAQERIWGYYIFPLLERDRLIGRIDMRADRKNDRLEVKRVWWEEKVRPGAARMARLEAELVRQARLAGVNDVHWLEDAR